MKQLTELRVYDRARVQPTPREEISSVIAREQSDRGDLLPNSYKSKIAALVLIYLIDTNSQ